ncbi:MAG: hypothetical protein M3362_00560 [Acidobacteriota bacterium]|nr:hypothetical protein [Acidobacteriota bacterium]
MRARTRLPSSQMADNFLWADEEQLKEIRSCCPSYHCRTGQLRPEYVFHIDVGKLRVEVCASCYKAWNVRNARQEQSKAAA